MNEDNIDGSMDATVLPTVKEEDATNETATSNKPPQPAIENLLSSLPVPNASHLIFANTAEKKLYWDRSYYSSQQAQREALMVSSSLYVGNLAFSTRTRHIHSHFSTIGPLKNIHMGLDRFRKTPCGFCFVEMLHRDHALEAVANLSGSKLDGRIIRVELDAGFQVGRQYGRGQSGGQVRDDRRGVLDPARASGRNKKTPLKWTPPDQVAQLEQPLRAKRDRDDDNTDDRPTSKSRTE